MDSPLPDNPQDSLPPFDDFQICYNITREELGNSTSPIWQTTEDLPPLTDDEAADVRQDLIDVLSRHAPASDQGDEELTFFVFDKGFDRTVYCELVDVSHWPELAPQAVREVQHLLRTSHPLWRVLIPGDDDENYALVIYPNGLRVSPQVPGENDTDRLLWVARKRTEEFLQREELRRTRRAELKRRLREALADNQEIQEPRLIGWFDTISRLEVNWAVEGKPGTSVWMLFPKPSGTSLPRVKCPRKVYAYWSVTDENGEFLRDENGEVLTNENGELQNYFDGPTDGRFPVLHIISEERIVDSLDIRIGNEPMHLDRNMSDLGKSTSIRFANTMIETAPQPLDMQSRSAHTT